MFGKLLTFVDVDADDKEPFSNRFTDCVGGTMGKEGNGGAARRLFSPAPPPGAREREAAAIAEVVVGACRATVSSAAVAAIGFGGSDGCEGKDETIEVAEVEGPVPDPLPLASALEAPSSWRSFASMRAILVSVLSVRRQTGRYMDDGRREEKIDGRTPRVCPHTAPWKERPRLKGRGTYASDRPAPALFNKLNVVGFPTSLIALRFFIPAPRGPEEESRGAWFA